MRKVLQKPTFRKSQILDDSRVDVQCFLFDLGPIFMALGALETASKFDDISWPSGCAPKVKAGIKLTLIPAFGFH